MNFKEYCNKTNLEYKNFNIFAYFCDFWEIKDKFNLSNDYEIEMKILLWEMFQLAKWIENLLENGNIISAIILLRTLVERIILFRIIIEDKNKIAEKIEKYIHHWMIESYIWLKDDEKENKNKYFKEYEKSFKEKADFYKDWRKYNLYKWLLWKRESFENLYEKYIKSPSKKYNFNDDFDLYQILSKILHWNSLNISFLNPENSFLPYHNEETKKNINNSIFQLIILISEDLNINIDDFYE